MAALETIRVKLGFIATIVIALGLLLFIVDPSKVLQSMQNMSSKNDVGKINGKSVSYSEFQSEVQDFTKVQESLTGRPVQGNEAQEQVRMSVWQDLIYKYLFRNVANNAGIEVGESEITDMSTGEYLSPIISSLFSIDGKFNPQMVSQFVKSTETDNRASLVWNYILKSSINDRYFQKYNSLFSTSFSQNKLMRDFVLGLENTKADIDFISIPFKYNQDSSIVITDSQVKEFYNNHKKFFKQPEKRDLQYVVFTVSPSDKDIEATLSSVEKLQDDFSKTDKMNIFLRRNSDIPFDKGYYAKGSFKSLSKDIEDFVWGKDSKSVSNVISVNNTFYLARVMDTKKVPDSVYVKHIMLPVDQVAKADSLMGVIKKGADFSSLVAKYSLDKKTAVDGKLGNIGWLTQSRMVPGFEEVLLSKVGQPFIIKTSRTLHIVEVEKATKPILKKQVALLRKESQASKKTRNYIYSQANKFATLASGSYDNFKMACDSMHVFSLPANNIVEATRRLGSIDNTKDVTKWAFDASKGDVSPIKTIDNKYFIIASVTESYKEGYADLDQVSPAIKNRLYMDAYKAKQLKDVKEKIKGLNSLEQISRVLEANVQSKKDVSLASFQNGAYDMNLLGVASVAKVGSISVPFEGESSIFIVKVNSRNKGSFYTSKDNDRRMTQLSNMLSNRLIPVICDEYDVKNNLARFY